MSDPTQNEVRLSLMTGEGESGLVSGTITWLTTGLSIEDAQ